MPYVWRVGVAFGLALLALGPICVAHVWRATRNIPNLRWPIRLILLIAAAALFVVVPTLWYRVDSNTRVIGIPFFSMIWRREGEYWTDFVGPFTAIASLGNGVVGAFLPFILTSAFFRFRRVSG